MAIIGGNSKFKVQNSKFLVMTDCVLKSLNPVGAQHLGKDVRVKSKIICQMLRPHTQPTQPEVEPAKFKVQNSKVGESVETGTNSFLIERVMGARRSNATM
jgi:hypothetical protein